MAARPELYWALLSLLCVIIHTEGVRITEPAGDTLNVDAWESIHLACETDREDVTWYKDDEEVTSGAYHLLATVTVTDAEGVIQSLKKTLIIYEITTRVDSGRYECRSKLNPSEYDAVQVTVGPAPVEIYEPRDTVVNVTRARGLSIWCRADIETPLVWYKNQTRIQSGVEGFFIQNGTINPYVQRSTLHKISSVLSEDDSATYRCVSADDDQDGDFVTVTVVDNGDAWDGDGVSDAWDNFTPVTTGAGNSLTTTMGLFAAVSFLCFSQSMIQCVNMPL